MLGHQQLETIFDALLNAKKTPGDAVHILKRELAPEEVASITNLQVMLVGQAFKAALAKRDQKRMADLMRRHSEVVASLLIPRPRGRPTGPTKRSRHKFDGLIFSDMSNYKAKIEIGDSGHSAAARKDRQLLGKLWPKIAGLPKYKAALADAVVEKFYLQVLKIELLTGWQKHH